MVQDLIAAFSEVFMKVLIRQRIKERQIFWIETHFIVILVNVTFNGLPLSNCKLNISINVHFNGYFIMSGSKKYI